MFYWSILTLELFILTNQNKKLSNLHILVANGNVKELPERDLLEKEYWAKRVES